jgi:hypothetical protein
MAAWPQIRLDQTRRSFRPGDATSFASPSLHQLLLLAIYEELEPPWPPSTRCLLRPLPHLPPLRFSIPPKICLAASSRACPRPRHAGVGRTYRPQLEHPYFGLVAAAVDFLTNVLIISSFPYRHFARSIWPCIPRGASCCSASHAGIDPYRHTTKSIAAHSSALPRLNCHLHVARVDRRKP